MKRHRDISNSDNLNLVCTQHRSRRETLSAHDIHNGTLPLCASITHDGSLKYLQTLAVDLLNPSAEFEKNQHKLKRLVQSPNSYFMDVKCSGMPLLLDHHTPTGTEPCVHLQQHALPSQPFFHMRKLLSFVVLARAFCVNLRAVEQG